MYPLITRNWKVTRLLRVCRNDAMKWAEAFCQTWRKLGRPEVDEDWMVGWFANAIMNSLDIERGRSVCVLPDGSAFLCC
jgi:hypothetical protein